MQLRIRIKSELPELVNKPSPISPHKVLWSWLINTVYHLLVKNNEGKGGGLNREGKLINFLPLKRGLNREFTVAQFIQLFMV